MTNVLVIDDTCEVRSIVVSTLEMYGFSARPANSGAEGIKLALEEKPDIIVCDLQMPGMDGLKTLSAVREHAEIANIPFIFLTGSQDRDDFRRGMGGGADDFLTKPFKPEDLIEAITIRLARREEIRSEIYRDAEVLSNKVVNLISRELSVPLDGIIGATNRLMQEYPNLQPDRILSAAQSINESACRLNDMTRNYFAAN